jgi:hypothetical protein
VLDGRGETAIRRRRWLRLIWPRPAASRRSSALRSAPKRQIASDITQVARNMATITNPAVLRLKF